MKKSVIATDRAPAAIGPYSQAVAVTGGRTVYVSGQIPLDPITGEIVGEGIKAQTHQTLKNLGAVLEAVGFGFENIVKATIFLSDLEDFAIVNELYGVCFDVEPPARATVQVAGLPKGVLIEIDAVAVG